MNGYNIHSLMTIMFTELIVIRLHACMLNHYRNFILTYLHIVMILVYKYKVIKVNDNVTILPIYLYFYESKQQYNYKEVELYYKLLYYVFK